MTERVGVFLELRTGEEIRVGELTKIVNPTGVVLGSEFTYSPEYMRHPLAYPLCPELPLRLTPIMSFPGRPIAGAFADASPDAWGRRLLSRAERQAAVVENRRVRAMGDYEFLLATPDMTRMGALRFVDSNGEFCSSSQGSVPTLVDLPLLLEALSHVDDPDADPDVYAVLTNAGTSMGGARPKATIVDDSGALAMVKLPSETDRWDVLGWEAVCAELARKAGINVPRTSLHRIDEDRSALVSTRFDRVGNHRVGYLSADSLIPTGMGEVVSYTQLAAWVARISAAPNDDLAELFRRVAFTIGVNNVDDHMRNHGLLRTKSGWRLSPMFDVNPFPRNMSVEGTPLTDGGDSVDRDVRELLQQANAYSLTRDAAQQIMAEVRQAIDQWAPTAHAYGIDSESLPRWEKVFEP